MLVILGSSVWTWEPISSWGKFHWPWWIWFLGQGSYPVLPSWRFKFHPLSLYFLDSVRIGCLTWIIYDNRRENSLSILTSLVPLSLTCQKDEAELGGPWSSFQIWGPVSLWPTTSVEWPWPTWPGGKNYLLRSYHYAERAQGKVLFIMDAPQNQQIWRKADEVTL